MSTFTIFALAFGSFALGALMVQFVRLPGLSVVCDNATPFYAICICTAVWLCFGIQLAMYRTGKELRLLGADLKQMLNRSARDSGASE